MSDAERAEIFLRLWQRVLRLEDWDISLELVRKMDVPGATSLAAVRVRLQESAAKILVADLNDVEDGWKTDKDLELTIVHELMHVKAYAALETREHVAMEQFVEGMARVLVRMMRAK